MNIIILFILALIDAVLYGYLYEQKRYKLLFLFWELHYKGRVIVPAYRILQGSLDIAATYIIYTNYGIIPLIGFAVAWYMLLKESLYYIFLWQWQNLLDFETYEADTYWLKRFYFSGYWLFKKGFAFKKFMLSAAIGMASLIISNVL